MKRSLLVLLVITSAFVGAIVGTLFTINYIDRDPSYKSIEQRQNVKSVHFSKDTSYRIPSALNFESAAKSVIPAVVHIRTSYGLTGFSLNALDNYLNPIEVVMSNNQRFFAKLIGQDPSTDLALLKIKAKNLLFVKYGNSDQIKLGEWVLAIGNPFDLNSTVTAGIVSARARNIGILRDKNNLQIESFIQTDAAVNPGNSGGALVNLQGELIGINSAIATATGSYSGYSFAIPVSLVKKIMDDLLEFGQVQRGLLGVQIADVTADLAENEKLDLLQGVFVRSVNKGSAAEKSGIKEGDVITAINGHEVAGVSEMQEWVARNRPGQSIQVTYRRKGENHLVDAILKKMDGSQEMNKREVSYQLEGAEFEDVPYPKLTLLGLEGGVKLKKLSNGKWKKSGAEEELIITHIDKLSIDNVADLNRILEMKKGGILVEGVNQHGEKKIFGMDW